MSANLGTPSSAGAAPPPASSPAAAPDAGSAVESTAAPAAVEPAAPSSPAVAPSSTPGASASQPGQPPQTLDEAFAIYHQALASEQQEPAVEAAPPAAPAPSEVPPPTPKVEAPPAPEAPAKEAAPEAEAESAPEVAEPVVEEPAAVEAAEADDDLDTVLTADELEKRFPRQLSKKVKAEIEKRESQRGQMLQERQELLQKVGGQVGIDLSQKLNPLIWKPNPTEEDAEAFFDYLVLPEHAGAGDLFKMLASHLINTTIQDEVTGKEFAGKLITEEWGKKADGSPFDFAGMQPLEMVDLLLRAVQTGVIEKDQLEFIKAEVEGQPKHEPSKRELELQRENEELRAQTQAKEAEQTRERENNKTIYRTQALKVVSDQLMEAVLPLATKANWAAIKGEEGPTVAEKQAFGELVADHINYRLLGSAGAPSKEFEEVLSMIDDMTAFDRATGHPTPRFMVKLEPLINRAKALFLGKQRVLSSRIKFTSDSSRNAQLVAKNGGHKLGAPPQEPPPPVQPAPVDTKPVPQSTEEKLQAELESYRRKRQAETASVGQL